MRPLDVSTRLPVYCNASVGVRIVPRGVLGAYETEMLDDDAEVESLALERTTGRRSRTASGGGACRIFL